MKDPHSAIKHKIYESTLMAALSIANVFKKDYERFLLVDLYAGKGIFEDGSAGSPLIALAVYEKSYSTIREMPVDFIFIEKDKDSCQTLSSAIEKHQNQMNIPEKINIDIQQGDWSLFKEDLQRKIHKAEWGFIFADPFANEIDMNVFADILKENYRKDVMIFINLISIKRQAGHKIAKKKIADFLDISEDDLDRLTGKKYHQEFLDKIKQAFRLEDKHYNLFAALPTSRNKNGNNNLVNGDYFCLSCSTNSIGVANAFLESYAQEKSINTNIETGLFGSQEIENRIEAFLLKNDKQTFHNIFAYTMEEFLNWRGKTPKEVPTSTNILDVINDMIGSSKVEVECPFNLLSKPKKNGKRLLVKKAVQSNENLKQVVVRLPQKDSAVSL